jgi:hypothetical protein
MQLLNDITFWNVIISSCGFHYDFMTEEGTLLNPYLVILFLISEA